MLTNYDTDNLPDILAGEGSWFTACLLRLIAKSDKDNRRLLAKVYPAEVALINDHQGVSI